MANVKFTRSELEKSIKLTSDVIEKIELFGVPIESITDTEIEIEVLPNRPDLLSIQGFIRAVNNYLGKEKGLKKYKINKPEKNYKVFIDSEVKNIRPYTACAIASNLSLDDEKISSLIDLQEKLHSTLGRKRKKVAIGIYPLEKISLPITYTALSPDKIKFIPLEFDKPLDAGQILQKHPAGKEYAHLLENFSKYPVFLDSKKNILSMPPIINSNETGRITNETKSVFIECSGSDFNALKKTLNIIITTLADMGGKIFSMELIYGKNKEITPNLETEKIKISIDNINSLLGLNLKDKDLENLLPKMGYNYNKGKVEIPPWRIDILHEVDIIEDIAIAYGYNNLIPQMPNISTLAEETKESRIKRKIAEILIGLGLLETSSYHLIKGDEKNKIRSESLIELENSKTEYKFLRPNLLIPALRILTENKDNDYPQKIFEIGKVFLLEKNSSESKVSEKENLIIYMSPSNFTEIKQILDYLFRLLGIKYSLKESSHSSLIEGRSALINANSNIGYLGDIHPKILQDWNIKMPVAVLEISLSNIYELIN
ncbi:MAG: phenylalanine--tRNA ligase subunit beta [Nanoarchaeota archaeon]|nr:phenylalanine--tRNA ligase subunit beta [Nanoarchaeota archaeon]